MLPLLTIGDVALAVPAGFAAARLVRMFAPAPRLDLAMIAGCVGIAIWASLVMPPTYLAPITCLFGWALLVLCAVDGIEFRLPDAITFPLIVAGLALSAFLPDGDIAAHIIGAAAGFIFFAAIAWIYSRMRGRDGLGLGDAKLLAVAGAWLGWAALPSVVLLACVAGFIWVGVRAAMRGRAALTARIPFGIPLAIAIWTVWLYGPIGFAA